MMFFPVGSWKILPDTGLMKVTRTGTKKPGIWKRKGEDWFSPPLFSYFME
jgi:hypothetical protein